MRKKKTKKRLSQKKRVALQKHYEQKARAKRLDTEMDRYINLPYT